MGTASRAVAERVPTAVWLNLGDLEQLLAALAGAAGSSRRRRPDPDIRALARKIEHARNRRLRAVQRAGRS
jgi:hypothetical protein